MAKEQTSKRVAKIAGKTLRKKGVPKHVKSLAGSALTQHEPKRKKKR